MAEIKPTKVFTRDNPCTKVDIYNCFRSTKGFERRAVVETRGEIGLNVPKYLLREQLMITRAVGNIDYYILTESGEIWLTEGLKRHLELHPEQERLVRIPISSGMRRVSRRRTTANT